jgi:hypothetical protein
MGRNLMTTTTLSIKKRPGHKDPVCSLLEDIEYLQVYEERTRHYRSLDNEVIDYEPVPDTERFIGYECTTCGRIFKKLPKDK